MSRAVSIEGIVQDVVIGGDHSRAFDLDAGYKVEYQGRRNWGRRLDGVG
jgi:hypothetical protein